jgi:UDP-glucuronate decarboxylase
MYMLMNKDEFMGPVNIGNPNEIDLLELAKRIIEITGSGSQLIFQSLPQDDPRQRNPDISLAKEVLNWEPKIPLDEGLKRTVEYFRNLVTVK